MRRETVTTSRGIVLALLASLEPTAVTVSPGSFPGSHVLWNANIACTTSVFAFQSVGAWEQGSTLLICTASDKCCGDLLEGDSRL